MDEIRRLMALRAGLEAKADQYEEMAESVKPKHDGLASFSRGLRLAARDISDVITKLLDEKQKEPT